MSFTFIHTADWQIGKRYGGFDQRLAGRLEEARLDAIDRLAALAKAQGAEHVLVAGDVYDDPGLKERTLRQPLSRMGGYPGITWVLLPGNHDPAGPASVWRQLRRIGVPANVIIADAPEPIALTDRVVVLPAPLIGKATLVDPTAWMDGSGPFDGVLRIGLAHGAAHGFGSEGECAVPIDTGRVTSARLDYLALGDWHGMKRIGPRCWYAGTPEPDNFANTAKGHALVVRLSPGAEPEVTAVATGTYVWARHAARVSGAADFAAVEREIAGLSDQPRHLLLQLTLSGALSLEDMAELDAWLAALDGRVQHLHVDAKGVALADNLDETAVAGLVGADPELLTVVARLRALARDGAVATDAPGATRDVAQTALLRLMSMVRAAKGDAA